MSDHERVDHSKGWRCASCGTYAHVLPQSLAERVDLLARMWDRHAELASAEDAQNA